uniref:AMOP domain-containing protein n=1 Tax=Echeneis naucrates TaxID=173247 RepID=A0A665T6M2_ECHNA
NHCTHLLTAVSIVLSGQTCRGKCGAMLEEGSCHTTCVYNQSCFQVAPHSSSLLGGKALRVLGLLLHPSARLLCRFGLCVHTVTLESFHLRDLCTHVVVYITAPQCPLNEKHVWYNVFWLLNCPLLVVVCLCWPCNELPPTRDRKQISSSVHCIRAIQLGSGLQCCYDSTGALMLAGDSIGSNSPDRAHDWASPPYKEPPRVLGHSRWLYDLITGEPSTKSNSLKSFDGLGYTFNDRREYCLVSLPDRELSVQKIYDHLKCVYCEGALARATWLSSVAMKEKTSDVMEERLAEGHLQVMTESALKKKTKKNLSFPGVFVFIPSPKSFTVMFSPGVGVEVHEGVMASDESNLTRGLLCQMNTHPSDDAMRKDHLLTRSEGQDLIRASSLFRYDSKNLLDTCGFPPSHDAAFVPALSPPETPDDPLVADMLAARFGDEAQLSKYDTLTTLSLQSRSEATRSHQARMETLQPVVSCSGSSGRVGQITSRGTLRAFHAVVHSSVQFDGTWTGEQPQCTTGWF